MGEMVRLLSLFEYMSAVDKEEKAGEKEEQQSGNHPIGHSELNLHKEQSSLRNISFASSNFRRNTLIFGIIMIILQAGICVTYGILFNSPTVQMNISSAAIMVLLALLIVAGNAGSR